ncbi:MAG: hypothetical protein R3C49_03670 [Planctomycetaceae bacterium]
MQRLSSLIWTVVCVSMLFDGDVLWADGEGLVVRLYDVSSLVNSPSLIELSQPMDSRSTSGNSGPCGGSGTGSGVGYGGGFGGGGGLFSVPVSGGQFGGSVEAAPGTHSTGSSVTDVLAEQGLSLTDLIVENVAPESWNTEADVQPAVTSLGQTLLVRQTPAVHQQIRDFLTLISEATAPSTVRHVEVWWLPLQQADRDQLTRLLSETPVPNDVAHQLNLLCDDTSGCHAKMLCRDRVVGSLFSGKRIPVVAGSVPVVGTGAIGDQPRMKTLQLGLSAHVRISPVASEPTSGEVFSLEYHIAATAPDADLQPWAVDGKVDRYTLGTHTAVGRCRITVGTPVVISAATQVFQPPQKSSEPVPELTIVVRVTDAGTK